MYVDFNGKRVDLGFGKKAIAALVTLGIVGGGLLLWQLWPRDRVVYVNSPVQRQAPAQQTSRTTCAIDYVVQNNKCIPTYAAMKRDVMTRWEDCNAVKGKWNDETQYCE